MLKKLKYIFIIFSIIFLNSCSQDEITFKKSYDTYTVSTGILDISNDFVGYTKGQIEANLSTKSAGRITYLEKNIGDTVLEGEKLVLLDSSEAKVGYSTAGNLVSMLYELKQSTSNTYDDQIKALQFKIEQALKNFEGVETGFEDTKNISKTLLDSQNANINSAKISLDTAQTNLNENIKLFELNKNHIIKNSKSSITSSVILYNNVIDFIDSILGVTTENKDKNDYFEDYLSAKDTSYLSKAKQNFAVAKDLLIEYKKLYNDKIENTAEINLDDKEIIEILKKGENTGEALKILLKDSWDVLDNSIFSIGALSESDILGYKNQISSYGNNIEESLLTVSGDYLLGLKGSIQSLENFETNKIKSLNLLNKQVELAKSSLDSAIKTYSQFEAQNSGKINEVETQKSVSKITLNELYASLDALKSTKDAKLKEINNKIIEAEGNKQTAGVMIDNGEIFSPINGIITSKNVEKGQVVGPGTTIYSVSDNSKIKVVLFLSDYIIKDLKIGDDLEVNIEGLDGDFIGTIVNIANSKDQITKKTSIELIIDNNLGKIKVGSMAVVKFNNNYNEIIVPNNAIISNFLVSSVYVLEGNTVHMKKINIISQSTEYSSISGLNIGDIIITKGKENIYDGEILN